MNITVAMPAYNASRIGWLALTGLQRQQGVSDFEIIICEEKHANPITKKQIDKFNLPNVKYIELEKWIPLPQKWRLIAQHATNEIFVLQAADCYPHELRLKKTQEAFNKHKIDWYHERSGIFYDIKRKIARLYTAPGKARTMLNMAMKTEYAQKIEISNLKSSIDYFLYTQSEKIKGKRLKVFVDSGSLSGFDTNGYNNISKNRIDMMRKCYNGYSKIQDWSKHIPNDVFKRIRIMK